jgi:D-alanyl-D-alanine carboxypeptidase
MNTNGSQAPTLKISQEYVASLIDKARKQYNIPAMAVVVMDSAQFLITQIQGVRVFNSDIKAELDDYFHIGSCSKSILAFMAGKLVEQGKINWDTKFFAVYPELMEIAREAYLNVTLEDLFLCQAGIQAFTSAEEKLPELRLPRQIADWSS